MCNIIVLQFHKDVVKDEYEQFDDYLEMVVQFGVCFIMLCTYVCILYLTQCM